MKVVWHLPAFQDVFHPRAALSFCTECPALFAPGAYLPNYATAVPSIFFIRRPLTVKMTLLLIEPRTPVRNVPLPT